MIPTQVKLGIGIAIIVATFFVGWNSRSWYESSIREAAIQAQRDALDAAMNRESGIAKAVEARLAELKANQTVIDRGVIREIIKPEYRTVCLPNSGVRLLNAAARGESIPAELAGEVSEGAD